MRCSKCKNKAVLSAPALCKTHFIGYFEKKFYDTVSKYGLFNKNSKVCVASSGGKDSTAVLYLVSKFVNPKNIQALLIDEGIKGYRDHTILDLKRFCEKNEIALKIVSFKDEFGLSLDKMIESNQSLRPCSVCGTLRRYLLNKHSKGFDVVVTGHNLDDESQAVIMNLFRSQTDVLPRLGPSTGFSPRKGFVQRVKPLYFCSEKESALYALLMDFGVSFNECPYVIGAYRADIRDMLNVYESNHKGTKLNIINHFLSILPELKMNCSDMSPNICKTCGELSSGEVCNVCKIVKRIRAL